jgi:hypothetical protein
MLQPGDVVYVPPRLGRHRYAILNFFFRFKHPGPGRIAGITVVTGGAL